MATLKTLEAEIKKLRGEIDELKGREGAKTPAYFCIKRARYGGKAYRPGSILYQEDVQKTPPVSEFRPMDERGEWVEHPYGGLVPRKSHDKNRKALREQAERFKDEKRQDIEARKTGTIPEYKRDRGLR
jgi:hypothetical protein